MESYLKLKKRLVSVVENFVDISYHFEDLALDKRFGHRDYSVQVGWAVDYMYLTDTHWMGLLNKLHVHLEYAQNGPGQMPQAKTVHVENWHLEVGVLMIDTESTVGHHKEHFYALSEIELQEICKRYADDWCYPSGSSEFLTYLVWIAIFQAIKQQFVLAFGQTGQWNVIPAQKKKKTEYLLILVKFHVNLDSLRHFQYVL